ncbi:hypothetical protein [Tenacibaculum halocynthiae]|uniref:hypothetical protein n=1 Tax=Tenacibaculum halocynthiae TaxID=1254437 RepID=UPI0038955014
MKKLILSLVLVLALSCTKNEELPLTSNSKTENEVVFKKDEATNLNGWGYIKIKDKIAQEEVTLWMTLNQYNWLRRSSRNQLDFIKYKGKPIYYTNSKELNFTGDYPISPFPFDPSNPPIPDGFNNCLPNSFELNNTTYPGNCTSKKQAFCDHQQEIANSNCEIRLFQKICCGNTNVGPLVFFPDEPCVQIPSLTMNN